MTDLRLPDFATSYAVLIGTGTYTDSGLNDLPGAVRNLDGMRDILLDTELSGFLGTHVIAVPDPAEADQVMAAVSIAGEQATDVLLVYYAGHGLLMGENSDLYMGLTVSRRDAPWNALPFSYLATEIKRSKAVTKILILDCCYSGRASKYLMADEARLVEDQLSAEGLYVMTSASTTKRSNAPPDAMYTAFTGKLIEAAREGVASTRPLLSMSSLFEEVKRRMRRTPWPLPEQCNTNNAGNLALIRNSSFDPEVRSISLIPQLDFSRSRALLIGVANYNHSYFPGLPSSINDMSAMKEALLDETLSGFSEEHCRILQDPQEPREIGLALTSVAQEAEDLLLVYYVGHSFVSSEANELNLTTTSTDPNNPFTSLSIEMASSVLYSNSHASNVVFILDTSYSGRAATALAKAARNVYLLASCGPFEHAYIEGEHGVFTSNLLGVLDHGLPGRPVHLTPLDLFQGIVLTEHKYSQPSLSVFNSGNPPCLFRNKADETQDQMYHHCAIAS